MNISSLSNKVLVERLVGLIARERAATVDVLEHLAEVDHRKLYLDHPAPSMTAYCVEALGYSEHEAGKRVTAARLLRRFPQLLPMLRGGELHLTALSLIGPHLSDANVGVRAAAARHKTKLQIDELIAIWAPKPDVPSRVVEVRSQDWDATADALWSASKVIVSAAVGTPSAETSTPAPALVREPFAAGLISEGNNDVCAIPGVATPATVEGSATHVAVARAQPTPLPKPLSPGRYRIEITVDQHTRDTLMKLRDHLRHAVPNGDIATIIARALHDYAAKVETRKYGKRRSTSPSPTSRTSRARTARERATACAEPPPAERDWNDGRIVATSAGEIVVYDDFTPARVPGAATRRAVAERDGYRCTYVGESGRRCSATAWLENDHVVAAAHYGLATVANLRLLCRAHNQARHAAWFSSIREKDP